MKKLSLVRSFAGLMVCGLLFLLFSQGTFAQTGTGTIHGTVTDPQNRAVAGATITLSNTEKGYKRTQATSGNGNYSFTEVPPGIYQIEAQATGFKKETVTNVQALVDTPSKIDIQLQVGNFSETVTITATGTDSLVNTQDATLGNTFVSKQIEQLPLEARNPVALLSLQAGVTPSGYVTGARADQTNVTLDGVDVNEQQTGLDPTRQTNTGNYSATDDPLVDPSVAFASVLRITPDSVQEFRVTTNNSNANQGRSAGAQVSLVTKSGTNEFHGSLYEFHRNTVTEANNTLNKAAGLPRTKLLRNVFGGSVGGPIKKDRLFFFYNYEGRRDASQQSVLETVPLPSLGQGIIRFPDGSGGVTTLTPAQVNSIYPDVGENPVALSILAGAASRYPANDTNAGDAFNTGGFRFNAPISVHLNTHIARFDYNLTKNGKHVLFLRGNHQDDLIGTPPAFPDQPAPTRWNHPSGFVAGHIWTISSRKVNTFRYGLTRLAFTNQGNSNENELFFRSVYRDYAFAADQVNSFQRTFIRTTPVTNITDDYSWLRGNHSLQFGANVRIIRNNRVDYAKAFDTGYTNYFFYQGAGNVLTTAITNAGYTIAPGFSTNVKAAAAAIIGRLAEYSANFNFDRQGNPLPAGSPNKRTFATEEYEGYAQDSWKVRPNLTLTYGLRYSLSRPVYETHGFQTAPNISLSEFFRRRVAGAAIGQPYNDPLLVDLIGPANGRRSTYPLDKTNFQPRFSVAYSPNVKGRFLRRIFGGEGDTVIRSGFGVLSDYFGQQLAVNFENNNQLGFASAQTISANTYNVTDNPAPQITGPGMAIRTLPGISIPGMLTFPQMQPLDNRRRIERSLDSELQTPKEYTWDFTIERKLPAGFLITASYVGRATKHLLASRDVATPNNLVDPVSHMDWYTAAGILEQLRANGTPVLSVPNIPYFANLFPNLPAQYADFLGDLNFSGALPYESLNPAQAVYQSLLAGDCSTGNDWTSEQDCIDKATSTHFFFQPQYGALSAFSTIGHSIYHGALFTIRQRYKERLTFDFNYTFSKSMDLASGLQNSSVYGSAFILNPLRPDDNYAVSDFDIRHIINVNAVWQLPVGRRQPFLGGIPKWADAVIGGWQLSGIMRYNSGRPITSPFDASAWATNWEIESNSVRIRPVQTHFGNDQSGHPNIFTDPQAAYNSLRSARPGETGDRNILRNLSYFVLDMGLSKTFNLPWSEKQKIQFRWETFNVTNTQRLDGGQVFDISTGVDPQFGTAQPLFGRITGIQGSPRVMQFGLRYSF